MANVYQQAAKRRKWAYRGAIVVLLGLSLLVRGTGFQIDRKSTEEVKQSPYLALTLDGRAKVHELTELHQGETQLDGAAVRLLLTGSRGLAVSALWLNAIDKQRKHEWSELDIAVNSIAKLQPHTIEPWLFQSWNLGYNVSVEMDRLNDMYYYIARGISIAASGESFNRNNPDLRYTIGFFYQNKFGVSDRVTTLRCLYQLSCLPEEDRDAERLTNPDGTVKQDAFEQFCRTNPQLVRRLKEVRIPVDGSDEKARPLASSPEAVVAFLKANRKVPTRYKPGERILNDRLKQFPVYPDLAGQMTTNELDYKVVHADHESDAFLAARAWYSLANAALPPPNPKPNMEGTYNPDPLKYRIPKRPATIIFRQAPMRAQSYVAERLTKEAWFDQDPWVVDDLQDEDRLWLPHTDASGQRVPVLLRSPASAQDAWKEAHRRWEDHGLANGLRLTADRLRRYISDAEELTRRVPGLRIGDPPPPISPAQAQDPEYMRLVDAHQVVRSWQYNRTMTNYEVFELEADALRTDDAMLAKKRFHQADKAVREAAQYSEAVRLYDEGFAAWKRVLVDKSDCRRQRMTDLSRAAQVCRDFRDLDKPMEEVYELNLRYAKLAQDVRTSELREATRVLRELARNGGVGPAAGGNAVFALADQGVWDPRSVTPLPLPGPLDGVDTDGAAWVQESVKDRVREKLGQVKRNIQPGPPPGAGPPGGPPAR